MPAAKSGWESAADRWYVVVVLSFCAVFVGIFFYFHPVAMLLAIAISVAFIWTCTFVLSKIPKTGFAEMMSQRKGENICTFRASFNLREVDPWIVRAVYEEVRGWISAGMDDVDYPIRASDRLVADLLIDPDELEEIAEMIAERAGYDFTEMRENPLNGKVVTVGDLVIFFTHQRRIRE